ncbi:MAG: glycosyltransferase [Aquificaceae bacterium]|nr:glycosyltransferase [Aquificaceae bacterium]MDW8433536.1 glycosyltransferase [Aquificaceae bacterium]
MRILLYVNNLGRSSTNGTAISLLASKFSDYLLQKGHEVLIVCNKAIVEENVKAPIFSLSNGLRGDIPYVIKLTRVIKEFKPHIVYAYLRTLSQLLGLSTLLEKRHETLYVGSVHNADGYLKYNRPYHLPYRWFVSFLLNRLDVVAGPSEAVLEDLSKTFFLKEEKLFLHRYFIDFERIDRSAHSKTPPEYEYILNVGRLARQKNQDALIRTFAKLSKDFPKLKLVIVGGGEDHEKLQSLAESLGLKDKVIITGYENNPWVYYRGAKLFALSSIHEGFGLVLLEAMYFKVPIVAFDTPAVREALGHGKYGILSKAFDEDEFYKDMKRVLSGEVDTKTMVESAYEYALSFSIDRYYQDVISLYKRKFSTVPNV